MEDHLAGGASRLAALLLPQILLVFSVVAPGHPGAALRDLVLLQRGRATSLSRGASPLGLPYTLPRSAASPARSGRVARSQRSLAVGNERQVYETASSHHRDAGLGTGANTAIFTVVNSLLLRTLPVPAPDHLVTVSSDYSGEPRFAKDVYSLDPAVLRALGTPGDTQG